MQWKRGWMRLTRVWRSEAAVNVDAELQFHFEQKVAEFKALGLSSADAEQRAHEEFGDLNLVRESLQSIDERVAKRARRAEWWESIAQDLKYVVRSLRRSPIFTATVVVTMALGLGANAAIFSVLDRLYVQPPAGVYAPHQLRRLQQTAINRNEPYVRNGFTFGEVRAFREAATAQVPAVIYRSEKVRNGRDINSPEIVGTYVEGDYFRLAGVRMALGRAFDSTEYRITGAAGVAVISYQLWQRQFAGDSSVIGKEIDLATHRHVIVGVAPDKFRGFDLKPSDIWVPLNTYGSTIGRAADWYENKSFNGLNVAVRIPGEVEAAFINARATLAMRDPAVRLINDSLSTTSLSSIIDGRGAKAYGKEVAISTRLAGVAAVILLIACANIVNLLLARAQHRQREIAVRLALGVSRMRLLSQLMIESAVLSLMAASVALAIAFGGATMLRKLLLPDVQWTEGAINPRVAVFTAILAIVAGFLAGLVPALQATRPDLSNAMKGSVREGGMRRSRLRSALLVTQAALSVVLLVGAGVFVRSLRSVESVDTGFDISQLTYASIQYDRDGGSRGKEIDAGLSSVAERLRQLPGVEAVALSFMIPMNGFSMAELFLPGRDSLPPSGTVGRFLSYVSPEYFKATGLRVLRGRDFTSSDVPGRELVMAMNEDMAKNLWPGEDPLTKCVILTERTAPCRRVVAIVASAHFGSVIEEPQMMYYVPLAQAADGRPAGALVVRAAPGKSSQVAAQIRPALQQVFGSWAKPRVVTMEELIAPQMRPWRTGASLFTAAGVLALLVAAVGVYSSVAYTISQRTREMGVRVALGASSRSIVRLVVGEGLRVIAIGVALGTVASLGLGSIVSALLYNTSPRDPFVLTASIATLLFVTVAACSIPAWRASRTDPLAALRTE